MRIMIRDVIASQHPHHRAVTMEA